RLDVDERTPPPRALVELDDRGDAALDAVGRLHVRHHPGDDGAPARGGAPDELAVVALDEAGGGGLVPAAARLAVAEQELVPPGAVEELRGRGVPIDNACH